MTRAYEAAKPLLNPATNPDTTVPSARLGECLASHSVTVNCAGVCRVLHVARYAGGSMPRSMVGLLAAVPYSSGLPMPLSSVSPSRYAPKPISQPGLPRTIVADRLSISSISLLTLCFLRDTHVITD